MLQCHKNLCLAWIPSQDFPKLRSQMFKPCNDPRFEAPWNHGIFTFITDMSSVTSLRPEFFVHLSQTIVVPSLEVSSWAVLSLGGFFFGSINAISFNPKPGEDQHVFPSELLPFHRKNTRSLVDIQIHCIQFHYIMYQYIYIYPLDLHWSIPHHTHSPCKGSSGDCCHRLRGALSRDVGKDGRCSPKAGIETPIWQGNAILQCTSVTQKRVLRRAKIKPDLHRSRLAIRNCWKLLHTHTQCVDHVRIWMR